MVLKCALPCAGAMETEADTSTAERAATSEAEGAKTALAHQDERLADGADSTGVRRHVLPSAAVECYHQNGV